MRALDPDGVTVVTAGTIGFAIGTGLCWWVYPQLAAAGKGWYLGVAITGTVIGLIGLAFSLLRARRRKRSDLAVLDGPLHGRSDVPPRRALESPSEDATPSA